MTGSIALPFELKQFSSTKEKQKRVILLAGPTGSGKTELSFVLANTLGKTEIVSADSMQVYRGMDIGTAKVTLQERKHIPHHLIDIRDLKEPFNVVDFFYECNQAIQDILSRGKHVIVVGGAGFYFRALLHGPPSGPPSVAKVRQDLEEELLSSGVEALFLRLQTFDPEYSASITRGDKQKIIRALEIIALTKKPVSQFSWKKRSFTPDYDYRAWFIHRSKEALYDRIEKRCEKMLSEGFVEEVKRLKQEGLLENSSASGSIGYKQCLEYLKTAQTEKEYAHFVEAFKRASRRYAKKQYTWFRKEPAFRWLNMDHHDNLTAAAIIRQDYMH